MELLKKIAIVIFIIVLLIVSFVIGIFVGKRNDDKLRKIQLDGVWKAQIVEISDSKELGDEYYFVFDNEGVLYAIDDDEIKKGNYFALEEKGSMSIQLEDEAISSCTYNKNVIKCELYGTLEKIK